MAHADVIEAAVIAVPDERWDERPLACVVLRQGCATSLDDLRTFLADRVVRRVAEALRAHLRDFDVLGRSGDEEFLALLPEPGPSPEDRIASLARGVADDVAKDDSVNQPVRVALGLEPVQADLFAPLRSEEDAEV